MEKRAKDEVLTLEEKVEGELLSLEERMQKSTNTSLSRIEVALADYDSAKQKPKSLEKKMRYLGSSHRLLSAWLKRSIKGKKDLASSFERLRDFCDICEELEGKRPE